MSYQQGTFGSQRLQIRFNKLEMSERLLKYNSMNRDRGTISFGGLYSLIKYPIKRKINKSLQKECGPAIETLFED